MSIELEIRIAMLERNLKDAAIAIAKGEYTKIHAIKAWRAATGASLKDSKDYIESFSTKETDNNSSFGVDSRIQRVEDRLFYLEQRVSKLENP